MGALVRRRLLSKKSTTAAATVTAINSPTTVSTMLGVHMAAQAETSPRSARLSPAVSPM